MDVAMPSIDTILTVLTVLVVACFTAAAVVEWRGRRKERKGGNQ